MSDAAKAQTKPSNDTMIVDEPVKPVAGSSKHPDDTDIINSELIKVLNEQDFCLEIMLHNNVMSAFRSALVSNASVQRKPRV